MALVLPGVLIGVVGVALVTHPSHRWWYDEFLPWMEPTSTALALIAALFAALYAARAYGREVDRDRRYDDERTSAQVSLVSAWLGSQTTEIPFQATRHESGVYLLNRSQAAVLDVALILLEDGQPFRMTDVGTLPPNEDPEFVRFDWKDPDIPLVLQVCDASGRYWWRHSSGELSRFPPDFLNA